MTRLTYLGHASFCFETDKAAIVVDPWLNPAGAFLGAWRQLPPNAHALDWVLAKMREKPVMVYVTHEHEDHYDEETLKKILPHADYMCVPAYENTFLKKLIKRNLGVEPKLLSEDDPQQFHDIEFRIFIDESGINRDSAIFMRAEGLSFFDGNDCKIFDRAQWLAERCGPIDILSSQFSGANMHPICYEMSDEEYKQISRQKKMRKFVAVRNFIRDMKPRYYMPSAGPAVFSFPQHEHLNFEEGNIFPKWWEFHAYMDSKDSGAECVPLDVLGSVTPDGKDGFTFEKIAQPLSDDDIRGMIKYYRDVDAAAPKPAPLPDAEVLAYFEHEMNRKIEVLKKNPSITLGCALYFDVKSADGTSVVYGVDPAQPELKKVASADIHAPYYLHTTSTAAIEKLIHSGKGWGTYFLSFLFRSRRVPDVFDSAMGTFFVANDDDDLDFGLKKLVQFRDSDESVTLTSPDGQSSVTCRRFCPHQGADLKYAAFDGKYVVCPRHQWKFDCENGGKADNSMDTIDAVITRKNAG